MPDQVYTVKLNGQVVQSYGFDELGRQTAKTLPLANGTLGHYYGYKHLYDNRSSTQVESFVNRLGTYTYTYDVKGNITQEAFVSWSDNLQSYTKTYEYDALNQLIRCIDGLGNHWYYQYDKAGNLLYEECIDSQNVYTIKHYSYENSNWRDQLTSYYGETISYDNIGNPTTYRGASLTWSNGRQLTSYSKNGQNISFQYDADGKRTSKTVNGTVYSYIYNQGTLVGICENDSLLLEFIVDEKGDYIGLYFDGIPYYYVRNLQGDVVAISDQWGNNIVGYTYDPWGKVLSVYGEHAWFGYINPIRYRGYFYDEETSLYYLQSRYYDPETNRFINADGAIADIGGEVLGYNQFAYCFNNPINMEDSDGNWPKWAKKMVAAVAVVAVVATVAAITVATAGAGTAIACFAIGAAKGAATGFVAGAITGAAGGAIGHRLTTGSWEGADEAALNGMADGALSGAITGAITGGLNSNACFVAGTAILTASGCVAIECIEAGDYVWASDPETGAVELKQVVQTFVNETTELVHVTVNKEEIICTNEHPFYSPQKGWIAACDLRTGDILVTVNGEYVVVEQVQHEILEKPVKVYNFEVEEFHTYYVGDANVLVHNQCGTVPTKDLTPTHSLTKSNSQMTALIDDIRVNGIQQPIKYVDFNGTKYIVDGHHRVAAAKVLELMDVPAVEVTLPYSGYKTFIDLFW